MIRIRLEGIISARNRGHPLKSAAKVVQIDQNTKFIWIFLRCSLSLSSSKVMDYFGLAKKKNINNLPISAKNGIFAAGIGSKTCR
jgi:hypothetical protein